ncbi:hypothetical protein AAE02nite_21420 [Adhaeribacter aerolatus]|uniref:HTH cro/C1-type domain-containing protein n=1 Tax=Adhaeribacter aerolatus TaxID=670289 RepID=A0A512AXN2_9BACT|nr:hypothetical protein AAE02nite_21420 [Adhaeribacter aerolatus]
MREEKGFSQQALADTADIAKLTILRIENGKNAPTLDMLFAICDALEISFQELMNFDSNRE